MLGLGTGLIYQGGIFGGIPYANAFSMELDGADDSAEADSYTALTPGANSATGFTVSVWINSQHGTLDDMKQDRIISKSGSGGHEWAMVIDAGRRLRFFLYFNNDSSNRYRIFATSAIASVDDWYHVVFTWDATKDTDDNTAVALYTNGVKADVSSGANVTQVGDSDSETVTPGTAPVEIGTTSAGASGHYWNGYIDEASIFNVTLDDDAVAEIYNSGTPIDMTVDTGNYDNSSNLVAYWRMGENDSGTTITNLSSAAGATDLELINQAAITDDNFAQPN
tara:strand:- start:29 stop:868 length:840 start_codon:yes stop_codon:yes gene_type:complete